MRYNQDAVQESQRVAIPRRQEDYQSITPRTSKACYRLGIPIENLLSIDVEKFLSIHKANGIPEQELYNILNSYESERDQLIHQVWTER